MADDVRTDGDCLRDFRRGDTSAFEQLVMRHQTALLRHARSLLGDGRAGEDAVQEAFMRLVQTPPILPRECQGNPELESAHLSSWLHRVTRNCSLDLLRSESRRKRREEVVAADDKADGGIPEVEAGDTREAVERGLARLPRDQREVLALRLLGERSYKEIASITGKKVGTVGWLVSTGLKALAAELAPLLAGADGDPAEMPLPASMVYLQGRTT